ncbi:MAG: flagellar hook-basal body protein [Lachnospiraceae bacterium]|nr:flagellar hook-basal body protein [Lachnospiraceae bacterium]
MMRSLWTAASGMRAQQTNVDTIANNLANVNTTGYKTQEASFKSLLYQNLQSTSTNNVGEEKPVPAEVGLGSRVSAITSAFTQGSLLESDRAFSIAIEGDGFYQVRTTNGEIQYTRDGNFSISPVAGGNLLCTADGYPVLDQRGNNIVLPDIYPAQDMAVGQNGVIGFPGEDGNVRPLMNNGYEVKFGLVQFNNPAGLHKAGSNNFSATVASGDPILEDGNPNLTQSMTHQFYTEGSNVDVANEMVNLIVAQRAYEMNSKAIQASDEMMQQANNLR